MTPTILSLQQSPVHDFSKDVTPSLRLLAGLGVEGDAHCGVTVQHRSRVAIVLDEGEIFAGDTIAIDRPKAPHQPLAPV